MQFQGDCMIIFQPALPMRGVTYLAGLSFNISIFQPALPMRGVTSTWTCISACRNFNPHSPCGE